MGLFSKKKEMALPNNLFDRIGTASAGIFAELTKKRLIDNKGDIDIYIWETTSYILATLQVTEIINSSIAMRIRRKISDSYPENDRRRNKSTTWMVLGGAFYKGAVLSMIKGEHTLPDVIVYNLIHPVEAGRKDFDALHLHDIDVYKMQSAWSIISAIMGDFFFRKDDNILNLPIGA